MPTRRNILQLGLTTGLGAMLPSCVRLKELQPECPINWAPSLISPVFYGVKDIATPNVRVYYPSIDGSPQNAELLVKCERYPLVMVIHGDCGGDPFQQWVHLPAQLARSGYIVAVTQYGGKVATGDAAVTAPLREVHDYMRNTSEFRDRLMPSPNTAVVGHSYGGTLAAQLAGEIKVAAFASLSGAFAQAQNPIGLLSSLKVPSLFIWNKVDDVNPGAELDGGGLYASVTAPKHAVVFKTGAHGDYLDGEAPTCPRQSTCAKVRALSYDFVTTFLTKYLHPEFAFSASTYVPESLFVKPQNLPAAPINGFYAGGYLLGMQTGFLNPLAPLGECSAELRHTTASSGRTFLFSI
jgi:dienelactone hydrolase